MSPPVSAPYGWSKDSEPPAIEDVEKSPDDSPEPYEVDVDEWRIVSAECCACEEETTLYLEPGDDSAWEHDEQHPSHLVHYWRVE
ncbi:hypothetical protein [Halorubrum tebenquichense]|uniref:Uncharacterized protein n=1 Tax=Halorubrum tebenquichense DSM 14210 TaxID=1227485 RepID=M0E4N5_9EURY|nr:hypothetical protein [Halorubrum tebenquichense]ELZ41882.1 hypothetical protein C472_00524 [Halorubrum tebenquichense DSM 14210]